MEISGSLISREVNECCRGFAPIDCVVLNADTNPDLNCCRMGRSKVLVLLCPPSCQSPCKFKNASFETGD